MADSKNRGTYQKDMSPKFMKFKPQECNIQLKMAEESKGFGYF